MPCDVAILYAKGHKDGEDGVWSVFSSAMPRAADLQVYCSGSTFQQSDIDVRRRADWPSIDIEGEEDVDI